MAYCIAKTLSPRAGQALSNRYQVKRFTSAENMHKFLNKQYDNSWRQIDQDLKSGIYFQQHDRNGARWIDEKVLRM